jgi:hypothetical protein
MTPFYFSAKVWLSIFILLKWQKSKLLHFAIRRDVNTFRSPFSHYYNVCFRVFKMDITQEVFASKILYALFVSAVLTLQSLVACKTVAYSNNSMRREEIASLLVW